MSTKITVGKEDYLLDVENSKLEQAHKVYFGSYFGNNMEASTDIYNNIRNFTIVSLEKAIIGTPEIKKAEKVEELECVRIPDDKGDSFQFEFDFYVDDDSITIVNIEKKNEPVNMVCERDRVEYGLNNQDIVYIKIKDLTKEEHDDFMKTLKENDVEIERKTSEVEKVLEESEETEDISIVQASMIGSRGWGYEDKESDIDIRFIFVRDPRDYISILQHEDSIAYPIEDKKDIVGYDLGKFLRMICNQNPTAYEILFSPKQERENQFVERLRQFATEVMDPNKMIMIYQNVVREKLEELSVKKENTTKASIYIIRMLGIIHYMEQNGTFPTCSIEEIFKDESNTPLKQLLEELIEYKRNGQKDLTIHPELIEFLKNDLEKTRGIKVNKEVKNKKEMERKANDLFQQTVMEAQRIKHQEEMEKVSDSEKEIEEEEAVYK